MPLATLTIELLDEDGQPLVPAPLCKRIEVQSAHVLDAVARVRTSESPAPLVPQEQIEVTEALVVQTDIAGRFMLAGQIDGGIDVQAGGILIIWGATLDYFVGANVQFKPATEGQVATLTGWLGGQAVAAPDGSGYGEGGYGEGGFGD